MQEIGQEKSFGYKVFPLTYLMPNFSFSVIILEYFIKGGPKFLLGLDVTLAWWCLGLATPFYILLYMYLDGVIPNAYGIRENFCFCVRSRKARRDEEILRLDGLNQSGRLTLDEEANSMVSNNPVSIQMQNLTKRFGKFKAVDQLNFKIYANEVLCLLGHNGAGKTTAINMLTGILEPSSGDANILGRSLISELNEVRQDIGLC